MKLNIPWIFNRRGVLIAAIIDFFTCNLLYNFVYQYEFEAEPSQLVTNTFAFFWIVVSYVLGRYEKPRKISFVRISKTLIKSIFLLFLCNTIPFYKLGISIIIFMD